MKKVISTIISKIMLPWDKARELLGESKGARLIAVGILLFVLTTTFRVYCDMVNIPDNFSLIFYWLANFLIIMGAVSYLHSEK